ncbi:MAG: hypothetical protein K2P04_06510, partial [Oscillospiraceae bacterium]|nr:hypothetical protein [Oscillospiraceae bacterium]
FFASSATNLHFFLGVFLHFIIGADSMGLSRLRIDSGMAPVYSRSMNLDSLEKIKQEENKSCCFTKMEGYMRGVHPSPWSTAAK